MEYPPFPQVGVGAIVLDDDHILLVRRVNPPGKGRWSVPGGHLKLGESLYSGALRELMEETGIYGEPLGIINIDEYVEDDGRIRFHYILIDVLIKNRTPLNEARPGGDVAEVKLVKLKDAMGMNLTRSTKSLVEKLIKGAPLLKSNFIYIKIK